MELEVGAGGSPGTAELVLSAALPVGRCRPGPPRDAGGALLQVEPRACALHGPAEPPVTLALSVAPRPPPSHIWLKGLSDLPTLART